ncbi:MAG TPA: (2Fe-2S) ferredoxin domain-containing protein [Coleofasciculaceae cyanobacterium]|jgi:(2Fe-2S) ferredoxin
MVAVQPLVSEFTIIGRLEDFVVGSKARLKYLYLSTPEANYSIEVAKSHKSVLSDRLLDRGADRGRNLPISNPPKQECGLSVNAHQDTTEAGVQLDRETPTRWSAETVGQHLQRGCWLEVTGMRKYELHKQQIKYKAYKIKLLSESTTPHRLSTATKPKAKVLICQSSTCWKKGGKAACELLQAQLQAKDMMDKVEIKTTGCLKQCKQAPNLVIMPGGIRASRVQPKQIFELIAKHL